MTSIDLISVFLSASNQQFYPVVSTVLSQTHTQFLS